MKQLLYIAVAVACTVTGPGCRRKLVDVQSTQANMQAVATAIELYQLDNDVYPTTLDALPEKPGGEPFQKPYLKPSERIVDAWGIRFQYLNMTNRYELRSAGADRQFMTEDDIMIGQRDTEQQIAP